MPDSIWKSIKIVEATEWEGDLRVNMMLVANAGRVLSRAYEGKCVECDDLAILLRQSLRRIKKQNANTDSAQTLDHNLFLERASRYLVKVAGNSSPLRNEDDQ